MKIRKLLSILSALALSAALIPAIPVSAVKAETEWNDNRKNADIIEFEDVIVGEIGSEGDQDVYRFDPQEDISASVDLYDVPTGKRWFLWVMDENWKPLANSIDKESENQQLDFDFEGGKTYYIVVCPWENAEDNFGGSYTLYLVPKHEYVAETLIEAEALATESSLRTLVSKSDLIAEVMAEGSHIETIKGTVYTVTSLRIMHTVKGDYDAEKVDVKVLGGGVDGDTLYLTPPSGYHHFIEGRPYLVFLKLYESSPASSVSSGASYSMTGKAFENYVTLSGQSAGFDEYMLYMAEDDYLRLSSTDLTEYLKIDTGKTYKKGRYIGEVEYDADSMTPGASVSGIISNCLPVGTKLYFAEDDDLTVIAEVGGEQLVFYAQVEE